MTPVVLDAREAALAALLEDATTVPPGRVDLSVALAGHLTHRRGPHGWTLGRFAVSPLLAGALRGLLDGLRAQVAPAGDDSGGVADDLPALPLVVVLPRSGVATVPPMLSADLAGLTPLQRDPGVDLQAIDVALVGPDPRGEIDVVVAKVAESGLAGPVQVSCEVPLAGRPAGEVVRRLEGLAAVREAGSDVCAKLRLAGTMPAAVPTATEVAGFLHTCARYGVPLRAHGARHVTTRADDVPSAAQPVPGTAAPVRPAQAPPADPRRQHGLLNLVGAAAIAHQGGRLADIREVLITAGTSIRLGSGALILGDTVVESETLASTRQDLLRGVGCSVLDGPLDQLIAMGATARSERAS